MYSQMSKAQTQTDTMISRSMSFLLRHGAKNEQVPITDDGYVTIADLITWLRSKGNIADPERICKIVANDAKGRYRISDDGLSIQAHQGHSKGAGVEVKLEPYTGTGPLIHGTYSHLRASIELTGLNSGTRQHIHMTEAKHDTNWAKLMRKDITMCVLVDVALAKKNGHEFFISGNSVVLTKGPLHPSSDCLTYVTWDKPLSACYGMIITNLKGNVAIVTTPAGRLGFPKGKKHKGECPLVCAYREVYEETGLRPNQLILTGKSVREINDNGNCPTTYFYAYMRDDPQPEPKLICLDPDELADVQWSSPMKLLQLPDSQFMNRRKCLL
jgi:putative RNA 2'-phosphotransferase